MATQLKEKEEKEYQIQNKKFISKGSEKILRDKSRASSNRSVNSFLARNYYQPKDKTRVNDSRTSSLDAGANFGKHRGSSTSSKYSSGQKFMN